MSGLKRKLNKMHKEIEQTANSKYFQRGLAKELRSKISNAFEDYYYEDEVILQTSLLEESFSATPSKDWSVSDYAEHMTDTEKLKQALKIAEELDGYYNAWAKPRGIDILIKLASEGDKQADRKITKIHQALLTGIQSNTSPEVMEKRLDSIS